MSWWVMEQVSVTEDGTQSLVNIQCDDVSDLPSPNQTATAGYTIVRGSQAKVLATSEKYILGGAGTWVKMEDEVKLDLTGYATEQYVDDELADKASVGTFNLTIAGSPLVVTEYSYSCIITGDIVTICIRLTLGAELAINTSRNLFKIPSGYYPPVTCAGTGYANGKTRVFWVNTSGDVKIRIDEAIPSGASINANFCYSYKTANWTTVTI